MQLNFIFARCLGSVVALLLLGGGLETLAGASGKRPGPVLILHDSSGPFGWIGGIHARMLANLVGHFDLPLLVAPVEDYESGDIADARAVFYLGGTFDNPLPDSFKNDVLATTKPVCWFKYNLWQVGASSPGEFQARFGFRFDYLDQAGYPTVTYRGETFGKDQSDPELGRTTVLNPSTASAVAWACDTGASNCLPYIVRGENLWYVADTPFSFLGEEDRYVIFADVLHDILGIDHRESHRALIRIEDVDPTFPLERLRATADLLNAEGVPFLVSVIPVYTDPLGYYNGGVPRTVSLSQSPEFQQALRYVTSRGGQIVLHGYTHQYGAVPNPYQAVSGEDYEFFRVTLDPNGNFADAQPVPEDSYKWAQSRVNAARRELKRSGFVAAAWSTPHYAASAVDYEVFGVNFPLTIQRALYFEDTGNVGGKLNRGQKKKESATRGARFAGQFFPYVIQNDIYGQKIVPENLGNVDLMVLSGATVRQPADLIRVARKQKVVRDGWASGFFHPFLEPELLRELVRGVKAEGYTYVPLSLHVR
jgi:uncharacterized protein YdaL